LIFRNFAEDYGPMAYEFFESEIIRVKDASDEVKRFFFRVPDSIPFKFKAGQFIMLNLPIPTRLTNRSYSIASAPSQEPDHIFELCIKLNKQGIATPWLWENGVEGIKIPCTTPLGKFMLPETIDREICFIATGAGIAPLRSMIYDIYLRDIPHGEIHLVFGNRFQKDILYRDEFEKLAEKHPEFHFHPVLSRESAPSWNGETRYVHPLYKKLFDDNRRAFFYICGWGEMVKEAKNYLKTRGYAKEEIRFELYD
jgi:ferredoxin-NADP reductase